MSHLLSPSILTANFANLQQEIDMLNSSNADWIHVDVMDGMFVHNISFGFPVIKSIKQYAQKPLDVHLMIVDPDRYIEDFKNAGADGITVHYEACTHLNRTINRIKELGCRAGVAINPHTPVALLTDIIADVDMVLVMSVNPGFGAQKFIPNTYKKIREVKALSSQSNPDLYIEIDGGVDQSNAAELVKAGANVLVAGNAVFSAKDPVGMISHLKQV
ncbi:ribulose-phosphate 3-epimerase [Mucilaginibacter sp. AW1-3]